MSEIRAAAQQLRGAQAVANDGERQQEAREVRERQAEQRAERNAEGKSEIRAREEALAERQRESRDVAEKDIEARAGRRVEARAESEGSTASRKLDGGTGRPSATPEGQRAEKIKPVPDVEQPDGGAAASPQTRQQEGRGEIIDTLA
jgi:hypothetical protein